MRLLARQPQILHFVQSENLDYEWIVTNPEVTWTGRVLHTYSETAFCRFCRFSGALKSIGCFVFKANLNPTPAAFTITKLLIYCVNG